MSADGTGTELAGELLTVATRAAREAGLHVLRLVATAGARHALRAEAGRKSSRTDLVSDADRAAEAVIVERLSALRPLDGIVAEEGSTRASRSGVDWVIDPIDGTTNFLYGHGSFAVSIAAVSAGRGLAGVVYDPLRDETYQAGAGLGAFCNEHRLEMGEHPPALAEALVGSGFSYDAGRRRAQAELLPTLLPNVRDLRRQGSAALDLCYVAAGRLDAYYEAGLAPWDRAAGLVIAAEAGCAITELDLGPELEATLVVAHPGLVRELCSLLSQAGAARVVP